VTEDIRGLHELLSRVAPLCKSDNLLVRVSAERIAVILVDTLFEIDPDAMVNPWDEFPWAIDQHADAGDR
jgi:hypothetical protein